MVNLLLCGVDFRIIGLDVMNGLPHLAPQCYVTDRSLSPGDYAMSAAFIGLDLAMSAFQVHGVDCGSASKLRPRAGTRKLLIFPRK
jgi:hypothetical protein